MKCNRFRSSAIAEHIDDGLLLTYAPIGVLHRFGFVSFFSSASVRFNVYVNGGYFDYFRSTGQLSD